MIDLNLLRKNSEEITRLLHKKDPGYDIAKLIELDKKVRQLNAQIEELRSKKNELSAQAKGGITDDLRNKSVEIGY